MCVSVSMCVSWCVAGGFEFPTSDFMFTRVTKLYIDCPFNRSLFACSLDRNALGPEGGRAIADALKTNTTLTKLE